MYHDFYKWYYKVKFHDDPFVYKGNTILETEYYPEAFVEIQIELEEEYDEDVEELTIWMVCD